MATIQDQSGANTAFVNTDLELQVALSKIPTKAGYAAIVGEAHDGSSGAAALRRSVIVSPDKRLGISADSLLWDDVFHHTVINTNKYFYATSTVSATVNGGFLTLNNGASVTNNTAAIVRTYKSFPLLSNYNISIDIWFSLALVPQAQNDIMLGIGLPSATATTAPTDGIYLEIDSTGALQLVANYNGTNTTSGALTTGYTWTANKVYRAKIVVHTERIELYFDGVLLGTVLRSAANTAGSLSMNSSGFLFGRFANITAPVGGQKLNIARWSVTSGDGVFNRTWAAQRTGLLDQLLAAPDGVAIGNLENNANNTAPASATLSNTAAGYTTLGGLFQFAAVAGAETDYALFSYQVPAGSTTVPGKSLVVTGIDIDTFNMGAAVATTPTTLQWSLGVGASAVTLATTDGTGTRRGKTKFLGVQTLAVGSAIGTRVDHYISADFSAAPLVCEAGMFFTVILRIPVGTATASQIIRGGIGIQGYFE